ncbi:ribonuclease D [Piscicoccus intestinalis]|uniref:ribonuclease D n=1 Tax=Piscicoccus intestinalis TaxID=746033 RepID=UPI0009FB9DCD|nr:ribonuclease D [Piscicoccus intestinalis]
MPGRPPTRSGSRRTSPRETPPAAVPAQAEAAQAGPAQGEPAQPSETPPAKPTAEAALDPGPQLPLVNAPADGVPPVVVEERDLVRAAEALAAGTGPVGVDAERASGYRYGQRAYLVQLRRENAGTWLIDPVACPDLGPIARALDCVEWILHAATQDLPCLAEVGMRPQRLFDTELGARLAGRPRVGLSAVLEHYLGVRLAKEHSAVDWSTRPLPEPWLRYAALDVELLAAARDALEADLRAQGKLEWARQEFDHLLDFTGPPTRPDPWRRTSGIHRLRGRRAIALVRELWWARDEIARARDVSPGRVLPDAALLDIARAAPRTGAALAQATRHKGATRNVSTWLAAVERGLAVPDSELPPASLPTDAPPPVRAWADRDPIAAARFAQVRDDLAAFSEEHSVPVENVLTPDILRRVVWEPPAPGGVAEALAARGARPWQVETVAPMIEAALRDHPDDSTPSD